MAGLRQTMKNKTKKICDKIKEYLKKRLKHYVTLITLLGTSFLLIFLTLSIFTELFYGDSFAHYVCNISCPKFLESTVTLEIIKILAFSNILVGYMHSNLDKKMLAISYSDIIISRFPFYNIFSLIHVGATILCFGFSMAGYSESSLITLMLVLINFWYQYKIVSYIVLNQDDCEKMANCVWEERTEYKEKLEQYLLTLASSIPNPSSEHYKSYVKNYSALLKEYTINCGINKDYFDSITEIWETLIKNKSYNKNVMNDIWVEIYLCRSQCSSDNEMENILCMNISCLLTAQLLHIRESMSEEPLDKEYLNLIYEHLNLLNSLEGKINAPNLLKTHKCCIMTNLYFLLWILNRFGHISSTAYSSDIKPEYENSIFVRLIAESFLPKISDVSAWIEGSIVYARSEFLA